MRLIDADALYAKAKQEDLYLSAARRALYRLIKEAPTVEAEPTKHGRWIDKEDPFGLYSSMLRMRSHYKDA